MVRPSYFKFVEENIRELPVIMLTCMNDYLCKIVSELTGNSPADGGGLDDLRPRTDDVKDLESFHLFGIVNCPCLPYYCDLDLARIGHLVLYLPCYLKREILGILV